MTFPLWSLSAERHELGLLVAVAIGFAFGFVLERAGFGRAQKLAAQFYGRDLTVFKVMFGAIVTAMLGSILLGAVGVLDYRALAEHAASETFLWPMILGGVALGMGFIVSGYCPGTSFVAAASGKLDGLATVLGVVAGQVAYAALEHRPWLAALHGSGRLGRVFLYELVGVRPAVLALGVTALAVACFLGAERLERALSRGAAAPALATPGRAGRAVLAGFGALAVLAVAAAALPVVTPAAAAAAPAPSPEALRRLAIEEPWRLTPEEVAAYAPATGGAPVVAPAPRPAAAPAGSRKAGGGGCGG